MDKETIKYVLAEAEAAAALSRRAACRHAPARLPQVGIARRHVRLGEDLHDEVFLEMFLGQ